MIRSTSETGHAKNVANFESLISFCTAYGTEYSPANNAITIDHLREKLTQAKKSLESVNVVLAKHTDAVNRRESIFNPLTKLTTRIVNAVEASEVSPEFVKNVKTTTRKLQGKRAIPKKEKLETLTKDETATQTVKNHSVSQMSFDQRINHLDELIQLLISQPTYSPHETTLSTDSLSDLLKDLRKTNIEVVDTSVLLSNTRIDRNKILYGEEDGVGVLANTVKKYVKSVFGATSPQYKQVSSIKFKTN